MYNIYSPLINRQYKQFNINFQNMNTLELFSFKELSEDLQKSLSLISAREWYDIDRAIQLPILGKLLKDKPTSKPDNTYTLYEVFDTYYKEGGKEELFSYMVQDNKYTKTGEIVKIHKLT